jgi:RNA polymerase sigma-70 factor (ECF subfamily)
VGVDDPARIEAESRIVAMLDGGEVDAATTEAIRVLGRPVLLYLMKLLHDHDSAQEVFARACEKLWKGIADFRRGSTVSTWFHRIAWNAAQDYRKEARHHRERRLESGEIARVVEEVRTTTAHFLQTEARDRFAELRASLDDNERSLLVLRVERDLSWTEIADVMDLDAPTLRKRFQRLKDRIRDAVRGD